MAIHRNNQSRIVPFTSPKLPKQHKPIKVADFFSQYFPENSAISDPHKLKKIGLRSTSDLSLISNNLNIFGRLDEKIAQIENILETHHAITRDDFDFLLSTIRLFKETPSFTSLLYGIDLKPLRAEQLQIHEELKLLLSNRENFTDSTPLRESLHELLTTLKALKEIEAKKLFLEITEYSQQYNIKNIWSHYRSKYPTLTALKNAGVNCRILLNLRSPQSLAEAKAQKQKVGTHNPQGENYIYRLPGEVLTLIFLLSENESALSHVSHLFRTLVLEPSTIENALDQLSLGMRLPMASLQTFLKELASPEEIKKNPFILLRGIQLRFAHLAHIENAERFNLLQLHVVSQKAAKEFNELTLQKLFVESSIKNNFYFVYVILNSRLNEIDTRYLKEAFFHSARQGNVLTMNLILGFAASRIDEDAFIKACSFAAQNGHQEILDRLLSHCSSKELFQSICVQLVIFAAKRGNLTFMKDVLEGETDLNESALLQAFLQAVQNNHEEVIDYLFTLPDVNSSIKNSIIYAARKGEGKKVEQLLSSEKAISVGHRECYSLALSHALAAGHAPLVQTLVDKMPKRVDSELIGTGIHRAINRDAWDALSYIIDNQALCSQLGIFNLLPLLEKAVKQERWEVIHSLLKDPEIAKNTKFLHQFLDQVLTCEEKHLNEILALIPDKSLTSIVLTRRALVTHNLPSAYEFFLKSRIEKHSLEEDKHFVREKFTLLKNEFSKHFLFYYGLLYVKEGTSYEETIRIGNTRYLQDGIKNIDQMGRVISSLFLKEGVIPSLKKAVEEKNKSEITLLLNIFPNDNIKIFFHSCHVTSKEKLECLDQWKHSDDVNDSDPFLYSLLDTVVSNENLDYIQEHLSHLSKEQEFKITRSYLKIAYKEERWKVIFLLLGRKNTPLPLIKTFALQIGRNGEVEHAKKVLAAVSNRANLIYEFLLGAFEKSQHELFQEVLNELLILSFHDQCSEKDRRVIEKLYSQEELEKELLFYLGLAHSQVQRIGFSRSEKVEEYGKKLFKNKGLRKAIAPQTLIKAIFNTTLTIRTKILSTKHGDFPLKNIQETSSELTQRVQKQLDETNLMLFFSQSLFFLHHDLEFKIHTEITREEKDFLLNMLLGRVEISSENTRRAWLQAAAQLIGDKLKLFIPMNDKPTIQLLLDDLQALGINLSGLPGLLRSDHLALETKLQIIDNFLTRMRTKEFWETHTHSLAQ